MIRWYPFIDPSVTINLIQACIMEVIVVTVILKIIKRVDGRWRSYS